jgi:hypothetical protein
VHAECEGNGHYCRQAFGNRRDGQCDGGHRRLHHLGAVRRQHAGVGRNAVAGLKQQNVARHQVGRLAQANLAVASHARRRREHVLQRRQRRFGTMLLEEAQRRVEQHHHGDHHGILEVTNRAGKDCGTEQDQDQQAPELVKELAPGRAGRLFGEPVGAVAGKALLRNFRSQSKSGV